ncbi:TVC2 protein, partial [Vireo altiloquus]|nr:TVC2 protein [Vireo altiloquus]
MLLLPLLALAAAWSHRWTAQVLLKQRQVSITRGHKTTTSMDCIAEKGIPDFQSACIHWYWQVPSKAPERILYIGPSAASYYDNSYSNKYSSLKNKGTNVCTFTISDINSNDEGTYYCAHWYF